MGEWRTMSGEYGRASVWRLMRGTSAYALLPLVGLITAPLLARALGPTGRGQLAAVLQPWTVAEAVLIAGLPTAVAYFVGRGHAFRDIRAPVLVIAGCTFAVTAPVAILYSNHISEATGLSRALILGIWSTSLIFMLIALRRAVLQGQGQLGVLDVEKALFALLRLIVIVTAVLIGITQVEIYLLAYIVPGLAVALILLPRWGADRQLLSTTGNHDGRSAHARFYAYAMLAGLGYVANILNSRLDQAALPLFLSSAELGIYSVAVTISEVPLIVATVASRNLMSETSRGLPRRTLLATATAGTILTVLIGAVLWALSPWLIPLLFGAAFSSAATVTQILLFGTVFTTVSSLSGVYLSGAGHPGRSCIAPLFGVTVLVVALILSATEMDANRAAIIVVICRISASIIGILILSLTITGRKARRT